MDVKTYLSFWTYLPSLRRNVVTDYHRSIFDIDFNQLKKEGVKVVVFDFDDTLADFHAISLDNEVSNLLNSLPIPFAIFSNCPPSRNKILTEIFDAFNAYSVFRSDKPKPDGFIEIAKHFEVDVSELLMVGDRVGTDMFGAYLANVPSRILVEPYSSIFGGRSPKTLDRFIKRVEKSLVLKPKVSIDK